MMLKLWQKKLKLNYSKDVFDIAQFGSSVIEGKKPNDTDIAVIFRQIPLKEQLNQAQEIKKQVQKYSELPVHITSFDLFSFFDASNFAKENILFYGRSLISGDYFSKKMGLTPRMQISYSLKDLEKKDKIRFNYMLNGKGGSYGLLRKYSSKLIAPGLIEVLPEYENIFLESMKKISSVVHIKKILY